MWKKKEINKRFFLISIVVFVVVGTPFLLIGFRTSSENFLSGFLTGSLSNWIVAYAFFSLILWSYKQSSKIFHLSLFGGMAAKTVSLLTVIIISISIFHMNFLWLITSVMVYYLAFQLMEIIFFAKYLKG